MAVLGEYIHHSKVGMWLDGPMSNLIVRSNIIVDQIADGLNFHTASPTRSWRIPLFATPGTTPWLRRRIRLTMPTTPSINGPHGNVEAGEEQNRDRALG